MTPWMRKLSLLGPTTLPASLASCAFSILRGTGEKSSELEYWLLALMLKYSSSSAMFINEL